MNFNTNFSELLMLGNKQIKFWNEDQEFFINTVKVKDAFFNNNILWLINFLDTDIKEIAKNFDTIEINSHYDFLLFSLTMGLRKEEMTSLYETIIDALENIIPDFEFTGKIMRIKDVYLDKDLFNQITEVLFKMFHKEKIVIYDTDDEFTRKEKEVKIRVQNIKKNSKKNSDKSTSFNDIFAAIIYEFPQYKIEDLFELNIYTFYYLFEYVGKIANYEVSKIAAGNGLAKKHKYFIEN